MDISIVIPAYNEENSLKEKVERLRQTLSNEKHEIIIVEDGCNDRTPEIAEELDSEHSNVRHLHFEKRLGKGKAIEEGFSRSQGDIIGFIDADKSVPCKEVKKLYKSITENKKDVVIASRYTEDADVERNRSRDIKSKAYNLLVRKSLGTKHRDHQCGLKLFRKEAWEELENTSSDGKWFWDTSILYNAERNGLDVEEVGISWVEENSQSSFRKIDHILMMEKLLETWINRHNLPVDIKFFRFAIVGAFGAILNTLILYILTEYGGIYYLYSSFIAIEAAIVSMFFFNNRYTFNALNGWINLFKGILKSNIIRSFGIVAHIVLLYVFTDIIGIYYIISNILAIFFASILNFIGERDFTWR